jgi:hypothetical protein
MNFFSIFWCNAIGWHPKKDLTLNGNKISEINFFCNHALIWWLIGGGLLNPMNLVQNPYFFGRFFQKISKETFVLVVVSKLISHFDKISHKKKTMLIWPQSTTTKHPSFETLNPKCDKKNTTLLKSYQILKLESKISYKQN